MRGEFERSAGIVIPTGRNGFCCIVPCALLFVCYSAAATVLLTLLWRCARRRRGRENR